MTRYWSTSAIFAQGSRSAFIYIICASIVYSIDYREYLCRNVRIAKNEVTRTVGNGIMIKSESLSKSYWADQVCI